VVPLQLQQLHSIQKKLIEWPNGYIMAATARAVSTRTAAGTADQLLAASQTIHDYNEAKR
jgi:hypothetical protein